jgi:hypothetical protein
VAQAADHYLTFSFTVGHGPFLRFAYMEERGSGGGGSSLFISIYLLSKIIFVEASAFGVDDFIFFLVNPIVCHLRTNGSQKLNICIHPEKRERERERERERDGEDRYQPEGGMGCAPDRPRIQFSLG